MPDIPHVAGIEAPAARISAALTTREGLACWRTEKVSGEECPDDLLQFRFDSHGGNDMKVVERVPSAAQHNPLLGAGLLTLKDHHGFQ